MAPSIVVHHERSTTAGPGTASVATEPVPKIVSTTMTDLGMPAPIAPSRDPSGAWPAPKTQLSFDKSAQVRPCSSQVLEAEEVTLPPVLEELADDVFIPPPAPIPPAAPPPPSPPQPSPPPWRTLPRPPPSPPLLQPNRTPPVSTTTPSLSAATASSATDTAPETNCGTDDRHGMKRPVSTSDSSDSQARRAQVMGPIKYLRRFGRPPQPIVIPIRGQKRGDASSDTSYSQEHRAIHVGPSTYPKHPNRPCFTVSSEEDEELPHQMRPQSPDSNYSQEHRATVEDQNRYPKRHLRRQ